MENLKRNVMKIKKEIFTRIIVFVLLLILIFSMVDYLIQPIWKEWNNYDTIQGFYSEPQNTIETIFLGASIVVNGITPMELYEDYGLSTYNLGTEQQPMLASYYWLEEAYRLNTETLKTVVLDVSMLRRTPDIAFYQKAIDNIQYLPIKYNAVKEYPNDFNETLSYFIPLFEYHNRWLSLNKSDFQKFNYEINDYVRGYNFDAGRYLNHDTYDKLIIPSYIVDDSAEKTELVTKSLYYLKKMIDFCSNQNIKLVLIKTPVIGSWSSENHNAVKEIANSYKLDFLDFNFSPLIDEMGYNHVVDSTDGGHMNYYGASKLTKWIGNYLVEECYGTNIRENEKYAFFDKQLEKYNSLIVNGMTMRDLIDPIEYLSLTKDRNYTVFIMVKDEGTSSLTEEQRRGFSSLGLQKLSELTYRDSYIGILKEGEVICEYSEDWSDTVMEKQVNTNIELLNKLKNIKLNENSQEKKSLPITHKGIIDNISYSITSGGLASGNIASCLIEGKEYAKNSRGINIVVYDNDLHKVVDSTCFDTYASSTRVSENLEKALAEMKINNIAYEDMPSDLQKLYLYNLRCENQKNLISLKALLEEERLLEYLDFFMNADRYITYISAMDDATGALDDTVRKLLQERGLVELSKLQFRDSYLAVINGKKVVYEQRDHGQVPITTKGVGYSMSSGGLESGNVSSIIINGTEYSIANRGLNLVVYDTMLNMVIDSINFDTYATPIKVPTE